MLCKLSLLFCLQVICVKCIRIDIAVDGSIDSVKIQGDDDYIQIHSRNPTGSFDQTPTYRFRPRYSTDSVNEKPRSPQPDFVRKFFYPKEDRTQPSDHTYYPAVRTTTLPPFRVYTMKPFERSDSSEKFSANLYQILSPQFSTKNLIYSPISLQSLLTILYLGAANETARQLKTALQLPESVPELRNQFQSIMAETQNPSTSFQLDFAQKIYFRDNLILRDYIRDTAKAYFYTEIVSISFDSAMTAAEEINKWVASKTHDRIMNIVAPETFNADTDVVLVNAIYLKAKWAREFSAADTFEREFFVGNEMPSKSVQMMYIEDDFKYGDFPELNAQIVELPFLDSELSMLIILPNEKDGLASVESRLKDINFNKLLEKMKYSTLTIRMPKFQIESDINVEEPLQKLGIRDIFTNDAQLGNLFSNPDDKVVSTVQHKAFINVNEGGLEAAASTFIQIVPLSLTPNMIYFTADHPFMFAIRSSQAVYFIGHVIDNFQ